MQSDTSSQDRSQNIFERIEHGFEEVIAWCNDHWPVLVTVLAILLIVGGVSAGIYEWRKSERAAAFASLAEIERELAATLPVDASGGLGTSQPANPELAITPKQEAIESFQALSQEHVGDEVGFLASLRAAELQVELGEMEAAQESLAALADAPGVPASLVATAHRLRGYVLEELERPAEAAEAYLAAAGLSDYPARADAFWQAGNTFERIGEWAQAVEAYDASLSVSPEFAARNRVSDRLLQVRGRLEATTRASGVAPNTGVAAETTAPAQKDEASAPADADPGTAGPTPARAEGSATETETPEAPDATAP